MSCADVAADATGACEKAWRMSAELAQHPPSECWSGVGRRACEDREASHNCTMWYTVQRLCGCGHSDDEWEFLESINY